MKHSRLEQANKVLSRSDDCGARRDMLWVALWFKRNSACYSVSPAFRLSSSIMYSAIKEEEGLQETQRNWNLSQCCCRNTALELLWLSLSHPIHTFTQAFTEACRNFLWDLKKHSQVQLTLQAGVVNHTRAALIFHFCWTSLGSSTGGRKWTVKDLFQVHDVLHKLCAARQAGLTPCNVFVRNNSFFFFFC